MDHGEDPSCSTVPAVQCSTGLGSDGGFDLPQLLAHHFWSDAAAQHRIRLDPQLLTQVALRPGHRGTERHDGGVSAHKGRVTSVGKGEHKCRQGQQSDSGSERLHHASAAARSEQPLFAKDYDCVLSQRERCRSQKSFCLVAGMPPCPGAGAPLNEFPFSLEVPERLDGPWWRACHYFLYLGGGAPACEQPADVTDHQGGNFRRRERRDESWASYLSHCPIL